MQNVPIPNLYSDRSLQINTGLNNTPQDIGENLFKSYLINNGDSGFDGVNGRETTNSAWRDESYGHETADSIRHFEEQLRQAGLLSGSATIPPNAVSRLEAVLKGYGLDKSEIEDLIRNSTDKDGLLHIGKLWRRLAEIEMRLGGAGRNLIIDQREIPKVEEFLYMRGLKSGEIKGLLEEAANEKGEILLKDLSNALSRHNQNFSNEKELASILKQFGINSRPKEISEGMKGGDLQELLRQFTRAYNRDSQLEIKRALASILMEKGIPPEEVKSFLDTLSVKYARSILNQQEVLGEKELAANKDAILNQLSLNKKQGWQDGNWRERILAILKEEGKSSLNKSNTSVNESLPNSHNRLKGDFEQTIAFVKIEKQVKSEGINLRKVLYGNNDGKVIRNLQFGGEISNPELGIGKVDRNFNLESVHVSSNRPMNFPEPLPKLFNQMVWMIRAGQQKSRIQLSPPELGRLDLELVIERGNLRAQLGAESYLVKEIIESNLGQLKQQLTANGFVVEEFEVMVGMGDRRSFGNDDLREARDQNKASKGEGRLKKGSELTTEKAAGMSLTNRNYQINLLV